MKRKVVLYGAFDRYNYGDNLMPILLRMYLEKHHHEKIKDIDFIYSSIKESDLSGYKCMPTIAMRNLLDIPDDSTVIVVGGEVLGATIGILYTHVQDSLLVTRLLKIVKRFSPKLLNVIAKRSYDGVWDHPYIPQKSSFKNNVKIVYNTVGAKPLVSQQKFIKQADYISARDDRTYSALKKFCEPKLVPDSVLMVSGLVDDSFFDTHVRKEIKELVTSDYISLQACPYKVKFTAQQLADELDKTINEHDLKVMLLPIGYASGHDDIVFLDKVKSLSKNKLLVLDELNVWEIMYVIAKSKAFYGTSLHGVITAMSFAVPHFSINENIEKLTSFVQTWSVSPYTKPITVNDISKSVSNLDASNKPILESAVKRAQGIIHDSLDEIASVL
ncbi:polysaccharide pyruvyl transferase family protein [Pantoea coffeiphila]|uniref:Polysaccharide pyruvyl transferase domain-containing protein n=1 Tax=Pantoea coffeiphila TaxID=1465635 RepID=A0A2S9IG87_9GAMM|nr:polysaccharide pyruvyl transferase family protein [Pantoea coffeiphila]PRD16797.1 hypothetical protein CQW29_03795 [Pantoea coffeiphila]